MDMIRRNGSSTRWRKLRAFVLKRDNYTCYYCGITTANTCDHLTPLHKGGTDELSNLVAACSACNYSKGSKTEQEFNRKRARKKKEKEMILPITISISQIFENLATIDTISFLQLIEFIHITEESGLSSTRYLLYFIKELLSPLYIISMSISNPSRPARPVSW